MKHSLELTEDEFQNIYFCIEDQLEKFLEDVKEFFDMPDPDDLSAEVFKYVNETFLLLKKFGCTHTTFWSLASELLGNCDTRLKGIKTLYEKGRQNSIEYIKEN